MQQTAMQSPSRASASERVMQQLDDAVIALSSAGADPEGRAFHIRTALQILGTDVMPGARALLSPAVADRLGALCEYMCTRLQYAHVHGVDAPFKEVIRLLEDLRRAWPSLDRTRASAPRMLKQDV